MFGFEKVTKLESQDQLKVDIRWNMPMISASFLTVCCVLGKNTTFTSSLTPGE